MQILAGKLLLSATDLVNFLGCKHASFLDLRDLTNPVEMPGRDAATILIFEKGIEHEKRNLASLQARGVDVVEVPGEGFELAERTALTRKVMRAGAEVIYQAALVVSPWLGYADFLERVEGASTLDAWSYEALDTKLSRRAKPEHVIQLTSYSKLIGVAPRRHDDRPVRLPANRTRRCHCEKRGALRSNPDPTVRGSPRLLRVRSQ
jgi:predicted RecB family nuclease